MTTDDGMTTAYGITMDDGMTMGHLPCRPAPCARVLADDARVTVVGRADTDDPHARARARAKALRGIVTGDPPPYVPDRLRPGTLANCTVPEAPSATSLAALERGLPVPSEEPMAADLDRARRLAAAADRALALAGKPLPQIEHPASGTGFPGLAEALDDLLTALHTGAAPRGDSHDDLRGPAMVDATPRSATTSHPTPVPHRSPRSPNP
ncbi:hypothetical protein ACFS5L_08145 [Streptomyces phyllanthi]|uniref:Uncharacterized protein n=1 Tax=Streptomyces phyllanthi TaxID=1803180 RepID=A0A5N8WG48_9ACTN|nr:hypothetical protein [Streptomyces phyllanthi]MPY46450.1 hypothetical protein [Streptomyces phyllanthi]